MKLVHTIYEPAGAGPHPTVLAFHGWGANALDLLGVAPYLAGGRFLTLCPQGPLTVPLGPSNGYGWFPLRPGSPPEDSAVIAAVKEAAGFVEEARRRYPIDSGRLVALGFSQGGIIATGVALSDPGRFAALVGISTWFPPGLDRIASRTGERKLPTLIQHGSNDDLIEIARARDSVERLRAMPAIDLRYREYDCGHEITGQGLHDLPDFLAETVPGPAA